MTITTKPRVRRSLTELQNEYDKGNKKPLEDLMKAWKGIQALRYDDPKSFFILGGYHGEPFRGAGWGNSAYWGGYCNHGNVLFPTWHRTYLMKLEEALQSIEGCEEVMVPFWDETSEDSLNNGVPWALTDEFFPRTSTEPNPLRCFIFPRNITDEIGTIDANNAANYSKAKGYQTVRYPLSGLVGTPADQAATAKHNAAYPTNAEQVTYLNLNVRTWLNWQVRVKGKVINSVNVKVQYKSCLDAPNYTLFSNTSSAQQYNDENYGSGVAKVVPLESPHNCIHLAVGGIYVPTQDASPIDGANGDMGENDTAALDPIFFFHHCFIDRMFWLWQKKHGHTDDLGTIIPEYPGTNSVDAQGPTPGVVPNSWLTLESPLNPFKKKDGSVYTSLDCVNIEKQLGYTYGPGSLEQEPQPQALHATRMIRVSGINRASIRGSFLICAYLKSGGKDEALLGAEAVLSRWHPQGCANCQTHLEAKAFITLDGFTEQSLASLQDGDYEVKLHTRDGVITASQGVQPALLAAFVRKPFYFEVR